MGFRLDIRPSDGLPRDFDSMLEQPRRRIPLVDRRNFFSRRSSIFELAASFTLHSKLSRRLLVLNSVDALNVGGSIRCEEQKT